MWGEGRAGLRAGHTPRRTKPRGPADRGAVSGGLPGCSRGAGRGEEAPAQSPGGLRGRVEGLLGR